MSTYEMMVMIVLRACLVMRWMMASLHSRALIRRRSGLPASDGAARSTSRAGATVAMQCSTSREGVFGGGGGYQIHAPHKNGRTTSQML